MKQKLTKLTKKLNNCMFDVATAPMLIMIFGVPVLLGLLVGVLVWLAVKAVMKIYKNKKREDGKL